MGTRRQRDPRFHSVLRLDRILNKSSPEHWKVVESKGYGWGTAASGRSGAESSQLMDWVKRMPVYMAVSLPDTFAFPEDSVRGRSRMRCAGGAGIPLSLMIRVRFLVDGRCAWRASRSAVARTALVRDPRVTGSWRAC